MKKIMIFAAVVCAAVVVNAAQVNWSVNSITSSSSATASAGWIAYYMDYSKYAAFSQLEASEVAKYVVDNSIGSATTTKNARTGAIAVSGTSGNYAAKETVEAFVVLFDSSSAASANNYAYTGKGTTTIAEGGATANMAFGSFASATSGWQSIPEPTSGLLILIGMAGLALKRKQA